VRTTTQSERHARIIERLTRLLVRAVSDEYGVRPQLPLTLGADNEPEPDLAIVALEDAPSRDEHPKMARLVIEVSGESLCLDRDVKGAVYAAAGIPEYWIVDIDHQSVEEYRDPDPVSGRYRGSSIVAGDAVLDCHVLPSLSHCVMSLFD